MSDNTEIRIGGFVKPFGIRGELKFHPTDDFWEALLKSKRLVLETRSGEGVERRPVAFDTSRPHGRSYVVTIEGVKDRNGAEALVGGDIYVAEDEIDVGLPGELLPFQVVGTTVKNEVGDVLGKVTSIVYSSAHDVYEVTHDRGSFMVPAVPEFIVDVALEKREMTIRPVPGLMEE